jgi:hypothetical protein
MTSDSKPEGVRSTSHRPTITADMCTSPCVPVTPTARACTRSTPFGHVSVGAQISAVAGAARTDRHPPPSGEPERSGDPASRRQRACSGPRGRQAVERAVGSQPTNRPHPGQSSPDEARMRMQMVTATARLLWGVLQPGTYVAPVPKSVPEVDDVTFAVGLVLARLVYAALKRSPARTSAAPPASWTCPLPRPPGPRAACRRDGL